MHSLLKSIHFLILVMLLMLPNITFGTLSSLAKNDPFPVFNTSDPQSFLYTHFYLDQYSIYFEKETSKWLNFGVSPFFQNAHQGTNYYGQRYLPGQKCPTTVKPSTFTSILQTGGTSLSSDGSDTPTTDDDQTLTSTGSSTTTTTGTITPSDCGNPIIGPISGHRIQLGDLTGRINTIALLYGATPEGQALVPALQTAKNELFPPTPPNTNNLDDINYPQYIDPTELYASLTYPLSYHKRGVRFDMSAQLLHGFSINVQTGMASITQSVKTIRLAEKDVVAPFTNIEHDLTCEAQNLCTFILPPDPSATFTENVKAFLTGNFDQITKELRVDTFDFNETAMEEVRVNGCWRHIFEINLDEEDDEGPRARCMPFMMLSGSISPGKEKKPNKLFGLPFGNDGHNALGFSFGINIDFVETVEIGAEFGTTHFFSKTVKNLRIPTNEHQKTLFPFAADARVHPGKNWHFAGKMSAYHFLGNLSMYFQYVMIDHKQDSICLKRADPAFMPKVLERTTAWKSKIANIGFTYDISPSVGVGFLWQAPLSQRNTYQSSMLMFSFNATF